MPSIEINHLFKKTDLSEQEYCLTFMEDYMRSEDKDSDRFKLLSVYHHELLLFYQFCKVSGFHSEIISKIANDAPVYDNVEDASAAIDYWNDLLAKWD
jgi:hypothetical protein